MGEIVTTRDIAQSTGRNLARRAARVAQKPQLKYPNQGIIIVLLRIVVVEEMRCIVVGGREH